MVTVAVVESCWERISNKTSEQSIDRISHSWHRNIKLPWPSIDSRHLKAVVPGAGVGTLALRAGADAVAMRLALLPTATVGAAVVEVEAATVHVTPGGSRARGPRGSGGDAIALAHLRALHRTERVTRFGRFRASSSRTLVALGVSNTL